MSGMLCHTHVLAPDVYAVSVNGDLVFLDVAHDAYVCLPGGSDQARLSADRRGLACNDRSLTADLTRAGLLAGPDRGGPGRRPRPIDRVAAPPLNSALPDHYERPRPGDSVEIAVALTDLLVAYRGRSFSDIVAAVHRPGAASPKLSAGMLGAVAAFHRWAPFAPTSAKCLLRSFMLLRLLRRRGHDALWVFGVRTWPFHAHCWLQCEQVVLDDDPDRIRAFTPIMVV